MHYNAHHHIVIADCKTLSRVLGIKTPKPLFYWTFTTSLLTKPSTHS